MDTENEFESLIQQADALRDAGSLDEAMNRYEDICREFPEQAEAHFKRGLALYRKGSVTESEVSLREALRLRENYAEAYNCLGLILVMQGRTGEAMVEYRKGLCYQPDSYNLHFNFGRLLLDLNAPVEAIYHFRRAVSLRPEAAMSHEALGLALNDWGRITDSTESLRRAIEIDPNCSGAWLSLGGCYLIGAEYQKAEEAFLRAAEIAPEKIVGWQNWATTSSYYPIDRATSFQRHVKYAQKLACSDRPNERPNASPCDQIRVGFVSGDFRRHSVANFIRAPIAALDKERFHLVAYYNNFLTDGVSEHLSTYFHEWVSVAAMSDEEVAQRIREDKIDVLIDLSGLTNLNRLGVFARKPAPVQITWVGYPNTTGLSTIDYRLTDAFADPDPEDQDYYTERLWRLPASFLCYSPFENTPPVSDLPAKSHGVITFGSFNTRVKIGAECIELWASVLREIESSRLVLKSVRGFNDKVDRDRLLKLFAEQGISSDRLELRCRVESDVEHLENYADIDIALDAFPYHGTTSTCEALWMGVPVISLKGDRHASRVGVSLLNNVGLPDLIAEDVDHFVAIAQALASDIEQLAAFRRNLRAHLQSSRLFDGAAMAADLAAAMEAMVTERFGSNESA